MLIHIYWYVYFQSPNFIVHQLIRPVRLIPDWMSFCCKYSGDYTSTDCDNVLMLSSSGALTVIVFLCSLTFFFTHICDKFIRPLNLLSGWAVHCDLCEHILSETLACMCQWDLCSFMWILQIVSNLQWNGCSLLVGTYCERIQPYGFTSLQRTMDYGLWCNTVLIGTSDTDWYHINHHPAPLIVWSQRGNRVF